MFVRIFSEQNTCALVKRILLSFIVVMFYCNIAVYLSLDVAPYLKPEYWVGLLILLVIIWAFFSPENRYEVFRTPLFIWCVTFLGLTILVFLIVPVSHIEEFKARIRDVLLLIALLSLFLMMSDQITFIRKFIFWAVIAGTIINIIGIFHCDFLIPAQYAQTCRSAGLYINPNDSAIALLFGMIFAIGTIPKSWRILFAIIVLLGVITTVSREAIIGWVAIAIMLCITGYINWKQMLLWSGVFIAAAVFVILIVLNTRIIESGITQSFATQIHRLIWFVHGEGDKASVNIRLELLRKGWELFVQHPWIGNGIGSTDHWSLSYSTHNMYLYYMDDYGVIGTFLYPLLIWSVVHRSRGETRKIGWCLAIFLLLVGFLNHDLVHSYYSLFSIAFMAAMTAISLNVGLKVRHHKTMSQS